MNRDSHFIINESVVRASLNKLKEDLDKWWGSHKLLTREEELFWLMAERFYPHLIAELFPDWIVKPGAATFCLERQARNN